MGGHFENFILSRYLDLSNLFIYEIGIKLFKKFYAYIFYYNVDVPYTIVIGFKFKL